MRRREDLGGEGEEGWVNLDGRDRVMNINLFFSFFIIKKELSSSTWSSCFLTLS